MQNYENMDSGDSYFSVLVELAFPTEQDSPQSSISSFCNQETPLPEVEPQEVSSTTKNLIERTDSGRESQGSGGEIPKVIRDSKGYKPELLIGEDKKVESGTLEGLIYYLTSAEHTDPNYLYQFMLTYRSITTSHEVLKMLRERYTSSVDPKDGPVIKIRVLNVCKHWMDKHWVDFADDQLLIDSMKELIEQTQAHNKTISEQLIRLLESKTMGIEKKLRRTFSNNPPVPFLLPYAKYKKKKSNQPDSMHSSDMSFLDYHPLELARQLTLAEEDLYKSIKHWEFFGLSWMKSHKETKSPNILKFIARFNAVSHWVTTEVLHVEDAKKRAKIVGRFLKVAQALGAPEIKNYNGCMEILSGLSAAPVARLKQTWGLLSQNKMRLFQELNNLLENNFKILREKMNLAQPPCIPYLGIFLSDLLFLDEGNPDILSNGLINFGKRRKMASILQNIQQLQYTPYNFQEVASIYDYLMKSIETPYDETAMYNLSIKREPRRAKGEDVSKISGNFVEIKIADNKRNSADNEAELLSSIEGYAFAEKDSPDNIVLGEKTDCPVISATLSKIIERLTYHKSDIPEAVHKSKCGDCNSRITGTRYSCLDCNSWDQCESCANKPFHKMNHVFLKLRTVYKQSLDLKDLKFETVSDANKEQLHPGTKCTMCKQSPIKGVRYKCLQCNDDLCYECERLSTSLDDLTHIYIRIQKPLTSPTSFPRYPPCVPLNGNSKDRTMMEVFFLTYRAFAKPHEVLELLRQRCSIPLSKLTGDTTDTLRSVIRTISLKTLKLIYFWVKTYWKIDFAKDSILQQKLKEFMEEYGKQTSDNDLAKLAHSIAELANHDNTPTDKAHNPSPSGKSGKRAPMLSKSVSAIEYDIMSFQPEQVANEMALLEATLFHSLKPIDFIRYAQSGADPQQSPQLVSMLKRGSQVSGWVAAEILKDKNLDKIATTVSQVLKIANSAYRENNMSSCFEIMAAFESEALRKIGRIWKALVPKEVFTIYETLQQQKLMIDTVNANAHLPYLKAVLEELVLLCKEASESSPKINFEKYYSIASKVLLISKRSQVPFHFQPDSAVRSYLIKSLGKVVDEDSLMATSEQIANSSQKLIHTLGSNTATALSPTQKKKRGTIHKLSDLIRSPSGKKET